MLYIYSFDSLFIKLQIFFCSFFVILYFFLTFHCCCAVGHCLHSSPPKSIFISVLQTLQSDIFFGIGWYPQSFISLFALMAQAVACAFNKCVTLPWNLKHWRQRRWRVLLNYRNSFKKLIWANIFFLLFRFTLSFAARRQHIETATMNSRQKKKR